MTSLEKFIKIKLTVSSLSSNNTKIIVVTKNCNLDKIKNIIEYGHTEFGENRVLEALEKWSEIKDKDPKIKLHLIGRLQSNKVAEACGIFDYIHSLDSEKLAAKIFSEQCKIKKSIKLFVQVNIGNNLSMGMSNDYLEALKCGSNYLRIGSAILGDRKNY
jgi:PLP dependent protein